MNNEPVAIGAAFIAFCNAVIGLVALIVPVEAEVVGAINLCIVALVGLVGAVVRSRVTPVDNGA